MTPTIPMTVADLLAEGRAKLAAERAALEDAERARIEEEDRERARVWGLLRSTLLPELGSLGPYLPEDPPEGFCVPEFDLQLFVPGFAPIHRHCQWEPRLERWMPAMQWVVRNWYVWKSEAVEGTDDPAWRTEDIAIALAYAAESEQERVRVQAAAEAAERARQNRQVRRAEFERHTPNEGRLLAALRDLIDSRIPDADHPPQITLE